MCIIYSFLVQEATTLPTEPQPLPIQLRWEQVTASLYHSPLSVLIFQDLRQFLLDKELGMAYRRLDRVSPADRFQEKVPLKARNVSTVAGFQIQERLVYAILTKCLISLIVLHQSVLE